MSVFTNGQNESLSSDQLDEIAIMVKIRDSSRIDELPDNYTVLGETQLQYGSSDEYGAIDENGYFQAGDVSEGGEAVAILSDDGRIFVSFAGTNDNADLASVSGFSDNSYIDGFEPYLESIANYASANGYTIELVTGKSLGGAATNMLADSPDVADGAYVDATFFAVASPLIADSQQVFNFGYDNDYAFEWYSGSGNYTTTTDNLILYNEEYADEDWIQFLEFSAHSYNNFARGITALTDSAFADELTQDSFVIISNYNNVDMNIAYDRTNSSAEDVYFMSPDTREDYVIGTDANDHIETGKQDDTIFSGDGDDEIYAGTQSDLVYAGTGNDKVWGGDGRDVVYLGEGNDTFYDNDQTGTWGMDIVHGGDGDDVIYADGADDELYGDAGNDTIYGGEGDDTIEGGSGNDTIMVGSGDTVYGGDDQDTFYIYASDLLNSNTITIDGGSGSTALNDIDDFDRLILGDGITIVPGSYSIALDGDSNSYSGTMQITDGVDILTVNFSEIESLVCFARGTEILTESGIRYIEDLKVGDLIQTKDNGYQRLRWIGSSICKNIHFDGVEKTAPIKIRAGALGKNKPHQDLYVSPQHRILIQSQIAKRMFSKTEVLVPAKQLLSLEGVEQVYDYDEVEYFHILLDRHEIVYANGAQAESLLIGEEALKSMSNEAQAEIFALFPELERMDYTSPARFIPLGHKSRNLAWRHRQNGVALQL